MIFKVVHQLDLSTYKLVPISEELKQLRKPYIISKHSVNSTSGIVPVDNTSYDDISLIGTRLINYYIINLRSIIFK